MSGGNEREDVFAAALELDWTIDDKPNKHGYLKMKCGCGKHITWLHKTPSNPNYYKERIQYMRRKCNPGPSTPGTAEG